MYFNLVFCKEIYNFKWISGLTSSFVYFFYCHGMGKTCSVLGFWTQKILIRGQGSTQEVSVYNLNCYTELALLGSTNVAVQLDSVHRQNIMKHKKQVAKHSMY